jgi:hypothetical protein
LILAINSSGFDRPPFSCVSQAAAGMFSQQSFRFGLPS